MVLVDTNVLAYLLIAGDRTPLALALWQRDPQWCSEPFVLIEFTNILATYQRARSLTTSDAQALLVDAQRRVSLTPEASHQETLAMAASFGVSAYDARFLVAASRSGLPLITEDERLRRAAPQWTTSLSAAVP